MDDPQGEAAGARLLAGEDSMVKIQMQDVFFRVGKGQ